MRINKMKKIIFAAILISIMICGCSGNNSAQVSSQSPSESSASVSAGYRLITQQEAKEIMQEQTGYIILDVRTKSEYSEGHIPGAICVPNETIGDADIPELPDKNQTILVYCRSGNRSKQAARKLADLGYTSILQFGGIIDWTGDVVSSGKLPDPSSH